MEEAIMKILNNICGAGEGELEPDMDLFESELLDSFGVVQLIVELEEQLHVSLDIGMLTREEIATPARIIKLAGQAS